jgi:hypothetical protein
MKQVIFSLVAVIAIGSVALAGQPKPEKSLSQKVCDSFQTKIDDECAHIMCDDAVANGSYNDIDECVGGDDYAEAAQGACDGQPTVMEDLVQAYNNQHPTAQITCE